MSTSKTPIEPIPKDLSHDRPRSSVPKIKLNIRYPAVCLLILQAHAKRFVDSVLRSSGHLVPAHEVCARKSTC